MNKTNITLSTALLILGGYAVYLSHDRQILSMQVNNARMGINSLLKADSLNKVIIVDKQTMINALESDNAFLKSQGVKPKYVTQKAEVVIKYIKKDSIIYRLDTTKTINPFNFSDDCMVIKGYATKKEIVLTERGFNDTIKIFQYDRTIRWWQRKKLKAEGLKCWSTVIVPKIAVENNCGSVNVKIIKRYIKNL